MDKQKRQSIEFDIQQLKMELDKINEEIKFKKEQNEFARKGVVGVGTAGSALALTLFKQGAKLHPLGRAALGVTAAIGAERGYSAADAAMTAKEAETLPLIKERDRIKSMIERRREELNAR